MADLVIYIWTFDSGWNRNNQWFRRRGGWEQQQNASKFNWSCYKQYIFICRFNWGGPWSSTGKYLSEALIFTPTNPRYDDRLFIELQGQYMKIPSSEHGENMLCTKIVLNVKTKQKHQLVCTTCSAGIMSLQFSWTVNNLLSYCELVDAKIRASDKDLPVSQTDFELSNF